MKVAILYDAGSDEWSPQDVAAVVGNVHEVRDVLRRRGHEVELLPVRLGDFRWLTVGPAAQPDVSIALMAIPGPPVMDLETAEQVRTLMAKGFAGTVFFTTDDVRSDYEQLKARGVEFTEEPEERPYGIDAGFRDPSGNSFRLTQVTLAGV